MPNPTAGDVHVNRPLTQISVAFMQDAGNFVAGKIFPNIPVTAQSDLYYSYDRGEFNRDEMVARADGTESAGGGYTLDSKGNYFATVYSFHKDVSDRQRANADAPLNLDRDATAYVTTKALIKREKIFVQNFFKTGIWNFNRNGVASSPVAGTSVLQWNNASSTPIEDIRSAISDMLQSTGFEANSLVLGYQTWAALQDNPDLVERVKFSGGVSNNTPAKISTRAVADLLDLNNIFVMKSIENTAQQGQTATNVFIGGKHALLCYAAPSAGIMTPTAGYTFSWTGYLGAGNQGNRIKMFRMEALASDRVEIEIAFDQKVISKDLGYFFNGVVA